MGFETISDEVKEKPKGEEAKKFVIVFKLPFDLQERLLAFPALHSFHDHYPEAEFHFITPKKNIEVLNLLPFHAYYHEFDEDEIKTVFDVHRFSVTSKIFQVDLFISFTNSFPDACLGVALKAKTRLGFSDGWKTLVLNEKIQRPVGHHITEDFLALYRAHTGIQDDLKLRVTSRDVTPKIADWQDAYVAINLSPLRGLFIEDEWVEYISKFENQRFIFFASDDQVKIHSLLPAFLSKLPATNRYDTYLVDSWIDLAKMLAFARGVVTYDGPLASFAAYLGTKTMVLYEMEDPQRYGPFYYMAEVMTVLPTDPTVIQKNTSAGSLKKRVSYDMNEIAQRTFDFFKLDVKLSNPQKI